MLVLLQLSDLLQEKHLQNLCVVLFSKLWDRGVKARQPLHTLSVTSY